MSRSRRRLMPRKFTLVVALLALAATVTVAQSQADAPFRNADLSPEQRAADLVSRMTLEEKVLQMQSTAPAIPRLGVPAYNWWNEALHGVMQGRATVFPQAIGLAATWDTALMRKVADAISTEARAKYHDAQRRAAPSGPDAVATLPGRTAGLTYWSPNINIFRDPRWGRGQETYGEDPYLTARMGVAFVTGMQGTDPRYLKVVATPKHFAVHSGPEPERHGFDAHVSENDLRGHLPARVPGRGGRGPGRVDHVRLQRGERRAGLREHRPAAGAPSRPVALHGLRRQRLRRGGRHPARPPFHVDDRRRGGGCREGRDRPHVRHRVQGARRRSEGRHNHRGRDHPRRGTIVRGPLPPRDVRSS